MRVLGLVTEYNPFHNGHLYHLQQSRQLCSADYAVCVMSGNFIQRGGPALVNKWARAEMALLSGVDLVIELPAVYAMSTAEFFASASVKILDSLGVVDYLCFGSESGNIGELDRIASILYKEPVSYKTKLKKYLAEGHSFPAAREKALLAQLGKDSLHKNCALSSPSKNLSDKTLRDPSSNTLMSPLSSPEKVLGSPNNILGIEYLKALKRLNSKITPLTIGRIVSSYNSAEITGSISSATSIRNFINKTMTFQDTDVISDSNALKGMVPEANARVLLQEFRCGRGPVFPSHFDSIILSALRKMYAKEIGALPYVSEGLENRIKAAAEQTGSLEELISKISTKRYPRTRIQRILFSIITGLTAQELENFNENGGPQYIRVLGFNSKGRELLAIMKKSATLPIIMKTADWKSSGNPLVNRMLEIESSSTDIYVLGYRNPELRKAGQEFTQNTVRMGV